MAGPYLPRKQMLLPAHRQADQPMARVVCRVQVRWAGCGACIRLDGHGIKEDHKMRRCCLGGNHPVAPRPGQQSNRPDYSTRTCISSCVCWPIC